MGPAAQPGQPSNNHGSDGDNKISGYTHEDSQGHDDSDDNEDDSEHPSRSDDEILGNKSEAPGSPDGSSWSFPDSDGTHWNQIIPRTSWAVPVGNSPYSGSSALITPRPEGATTTLEQQNHRVACLRNLLGEPSGVTNDELRAALEGTRWDMGSALRFMNHRFNAARRRQRASQPGRSSNQGGADRLLGADSLHHNRRRAIDALYQRLISAQPAAGHQLTTLNVGVLLADNRFDLDNAVDAFRERQIHLQQFQDATRRLRRLRIQDPNQVHQDGRVALFMTIAGIDDYYAARVLFETHNWDMGRVMDQWMQHGLRWAPNAAPPNVRRRSTYQEPTLPHDDTENLWATGRPFGTVPPAPDAQDLLDAAEDYDQGTYAGRNGWFINFRRDPGVRVGVINPSRMGLLWIRRGDFKLLWYGDRAPVEDPRRPGQRLIHGGTEPFDWNNSFHVGDLGGRMTSQWFRRGTGTRTKVRGSSYQSDENEWLWNWHNDRLFEYMNARPEFWRHEPHPGTTGTWNGTWNEIRNQEWPTPIPYPLQRLRRDFNHRFTNQVHLTGMNGQPRQTRTANALDMQRRRVAAICEDFGFDPSPAHPTLDPPNGDEGGDEEEDDGDEGSSGISAPKGNNSKRKASDSGVTWEDGENGPDGGNDGSDRTSAKRLKPNSGGEGKSEGKGKGKAVESEDDSGYGEDDI
jgi:hypothetical protein